MNKSAQVLEFCNFWYGMPKQLGVKRKEYIDAILPSFDTNLIKVLIGQRRSGKSYFIKQLIHYFLTEKKVKPKNILYLNFEFRELKEFCTADKLYELLTYYFEKYFVGSKAYIFLDEVQEVQGWEKIVISMQANEKRPVQLVITGSNSTLLSSELSTFLTGRFVERRIYPFRYEELLMIKKQKNNKKHFVDFLQHSGIPELHNLPSEELRISYITALKDSILMKDIVFRYDVKNSYLLDVLFMFIVDNIGNLFSINSIVKKLQNINIKTNAITIAQYIKYLEDTFLIYGIRRYDVKGKKILEGERKYYLNDLGFKNYLSSNFDIGLNKNLENAIFYFLQSCGYQLYVGKLKEVEIDFIAEKNNKRLYVQVTYLLSDDKVVEREYGNLEKIADNWPKVVVSLDDVQLPEKKGIIHVQAWNFADFLKKLEVY